MGLRFHLIKSEKFFFTVNVFFLCIHKNLLYTDKHGIEREYNSLCNFLSTKMECRDFYCRFVWNCGNEKKQKFLK